MLSALRWGWRLVALALVLSVLLVGVVAGRVWWFARSDARAPADALIVLGAAQFDGTPSEVFEARLRHAQALYLDGVAPRIVTVGGGQPGDRFTEAEAGERWLVAHDVPGEDVVPVSSGEDTLTSLTAAGEEFGEQGWETAVVVTDPWHALRSAAMAEDQGIEVQSSPTRSGPSVRNRSTQVRYIARETAAYMYWRLLGESADSGPDAL